jgi:hypothetical protein
MRIKSNKRRVKGLILVLSFSLIFNACKKEEDPFDYRLLIGKWEMESEHCKEFFDGELAFDEDHPYPAGEKFLEFKSDGTGTSYQVDSIAFTFDWTRTDDRITINVTNQGVIEHYIIQSLDQDILIYRIRLYELLGDVGMEYISNCDYTLYRVPDL